jgi:hypothetical protein
MFSPWQKKNRQALGAGGFFGFGRSSLAGPFRQQAGKVKEPEGKPVRHRLH